VDTNFVINSTSSCHISEESSHSCGHKEFMTIDGTKKMWVPEAFASRKWQPTGQDVV